MISETDAEIEEQGGEEVNGFEELPQDIDDQEDPENDEPEDEPDEEVDYIEDTPYETESDPPTPPPKRKRKRGRPAHTPNKKTQLRPPTRSQTLEVLHLEMLDEIKASGQKLEDMLNEAVKYHKKIFDNRKQYFDSENRRLDLLEERMLLGKNPVRHIPTTASAPGGNADNERGFGDFLDEKDDRDFFRSLRVTKETYNYLLNEINDKYAPIYRGGRAPIESALALKLCLWFLGNKGTFKEMAELFGVSESAVFKSVHIVVDIICSLSVQFIKWPTGDRLTEVENSFRSICGFPGVVGALDGTHVKIRAPKYIKADFVDRTSQHSVNLMAVCDSDRRFTFIEAGFPGSAPDSSVLKNTKLFNLMWNSPKDLFPTDNAHIIGDCAFELSKYVLVPYIDYGNLTESQKKFNQKLCLTRSVISNAFSLLKGRFARLKYIDADVSRISKIIVACCVIHNITLDNAREEELLRIEGEVIPVVEENDYNYPHINLLDMEGSAKRDFISTFLV